MARAGKSNQPSLWHTKTNGGDSQSHATGAAITQEAAKGEKVNYLLEGFTTVGQWLLWVIGALLAIGLAGLIMLGLLYLISTAILWFRDWKDNHEKHDG